MTGLAAFDPDAFLGDQPEPAPIVQAPDVSTDIPLDWQTGLVRLAEMPFPYGATPHRWQQIVDDAIFFSRTRFREAIEAGWSTGNVFGFDPEQFNSFVGLVIDLRGDVVIDLNREYATIRTARGYRYHYRHMPDDSVPIWAYRAGRR